MSDIWRHTHPVTLFVHGTVTTIGTLTNDVKFISSDLHKKQRQRNRLPSASEILSHLASDRTTQLPIIIPDA